METIEKEKAIDVVRQMVADGQVSQEVAEKYFPELKESNGERIRQLLMRFVKYDMPDNYSDDISKEECLAWIEKEDKKKSIDDLTQQEAKDIAVAKCYEWDEQEPVDEVEPKFNVGQTIKKEGFNLGFTIVKIEDGFYYNDVGDHFPFTDQDNWELVEQKPWSEEDEMFVHGLIRGLAAKRDIHGHTTFSSVCIDITGTINWLKSLKDRYTWKPSEEQMNLLREVQQALLGKDCHNRFVNFMYELKRLREG